MKKIIFIMNILFSIINATPIFEQNNFNIMNISEKESAEDKKCNMIEMLNQYKIQPIQINNSCNLDELVFELEDCVEEIPTKKTIIPLKIIGNTEYILWKNKVNGKLFYGKQNKIIIKCLYNIETLKKEYYIYDDKQNLLNKRNIKLKDIKLKKNFKIYHP